MRVVIMAGCVPDGKALFVQRGVWLPAEPLQQQQGLGQSAACLHCDAMVDVV